MADSTAPEKLPLTVRTQYAELMDLSEDDWETGYALPTLSTKKSRGRTYWYESYSVAGRRVQKYFAPDDEDGRRIVEQRKREIADRRATFEMRTGICRALVAAAGRAVDPATGRILKALADAGAFANDAIVVGTNAYGIYGHMLGRKLSAIHAQTGDLDIAVIDLAVPEPVSFAEVIQAAEDNMLIVPPRPHARISTKLKIARGDFRVELLTPGKGQAQGPVVIEGFKFGALPLRYLDYLVDEPVAAIAPVEMGVRVNVPLPERFALHKLIVAQLRRRDEFAKREKDLYQAGELIAVLRDDLPRELAAAWNDLQSYGEDYRANAEASLALLGIDPRDLAGPR